MNLRPPGYEPGELPDCSTPRRGPDCSTLVTLVSMWDWAIRAALVLDTLRLFSGIDIGSTHAASFYNPVAAVPSLHAAYAVGVGVGLIQFGRAWSRAAGAIYPPTVVWTVVVTGNHFVVDAVAGAAVLGVGFVLAHANGAILRPATRGGAVR